MKIKKISKKVTIRKLPPKHTNIKVLPAKTPLEILEHQLEFGRGGIPYSEK